MLFRSPPWSYPRLCVAVPNCNAHRAGQDGSALIGQRIAMLTAEMDSERRSRQDRRLAALQPLVPELQSGMGRGEIEILFQPQYAALDRRLVGAEALAHWRHPEKGRIGGDRLFAIAAQGGLVEALSGHVMRTALDAAGNWSVPVRLSLNVTAADVAGGDFAEIVMFAVRDAGFPAEHLTLEITEQVLLAELDRTAEKLRRLSVLGIRIALDDFGAGFCNFDYLKRLPLHYLKLDRGMIAGIDQDPRDL